MGQPSCKGRREVTTGWARDWDSCRWCGGRYRSGFGRSIRGRAAKGAWNTGCDDDWRWERGWGKLWGRGSIYWRIRQWRGKPRRGGNARWRKWWDCAWKWRRDHGRQRAWWAFYFWGDDCRWCGGAGWKSRKAWCQWKRHSGRTSVRWFRRDGRFSQSRRTGFRGARHYSSRSRGSGTSRSSRPRRA